MIAFVVVVVVFFFSEVGAESFMYIHCRTACVTITVYLKSCRHINFK